MSRDDHLNWFHGSLTRDAADDLLKQGYEDGTFLVRESSTAAGDFVLSLLYQGEVCHYQIRRHGEDAFFSIDDKVQTKILHGLDTLVEYYQEAANGLVTHLTVPLIRDAPPHNTRSHGVTNLLHRATGKNDSKVVFELLKCGYRNFDAKNQDGQTALHLAALHCDEEILKLLLDARVQVNSMDSFGYQPLHYACRHKSATFIRTLIAAQANVQGRNIENGHVPLHEAAKYGNLEAVQELLEAHAPLLPRTNSGEFPFDLAKESGQTQVEGFLLNYKLPLANTNKEQWYHGTLTRDEATSILKKHASDQQASQLAASHTSDTSGCFLVRYSESPAGAGYVLTLLCEGMTKNFRISQAELFQYIKARPDLGRSSLQSKFLYIDDGPYWPSLEHLVEHFMRFSYGLPVRLRYPVPPQPKPELPSFATIPRSIPKRTLPAAIDCHVSTIGITKKKESSSMFNTLRLTSPKKALFDMNSLRKCKTKPKRNKSESEVSVGKAHHNTEEFHATAPMLQNLRFFTEFSSVQTDSGGNANPPLGAAAIEFYNVPKNNSAVEPPLPSTLNISTKTEAENEYFTKSDLLITRDRDLNSNGYLPTTDVRFVVDSGEGSQIIKEIGYDRKQTARLDSFISSCSTESEMASYLHRQCNGSFTSENPSTDTNKERFFIQAENIEREGVIGEGEFGSVYKGWLLTRNSTTGADVRVEVAIKTLRDEHSNKKEFLREASAMIRLQHQCIVQLIGIAKDPENLMMVQELASLGSMLHFIINNSEQIRDCSEFKLWASQIAEGMNYLVSQHFVHRDLAARNILLASRRQAKISDFGMSRSLSTDSDQYTFTQGGKWPLRWYAPESFNNGIFSHASDVWSFGITLWEMWALGKPPYGEISNVDVIKLVDSGQRLPKPDLCPVNIYAIMHSCWNYSPKNRPTFAYLKEFFARTLDYQNLLEMAETVRI